MSQLHIVNQSLEHVIKHQSFILIGEVLNVSEKDWQVTVLLDQVIETEEFEMLEEETLEFSVGDKAVLKVYSGVVWDNPDYSPCDLVTKERMFISQVKRGMKILAIRSRGDFEVFEYDKFLKEALPYFLDESKMNELIEKLSHDRETILKYYKNTYLNKTALQPMLDNNWIEMEHFYTCFIDQFHGEQFPEYIKKHTRENNDRFIIDTIEHYRSMENSERQRYMGLKDPLVNPEIIHCFSNQMIATLSLMVAKVYSHAFGGLGYKLCNAPHDAIELLTAGLMIDILSPEELSKIEVPVDLQEPLNKMLKTLKGFPQTELDHNFDHTLNLILKKIKFSNQYLHFFASLFASIYLRDSGYFNFEYIYKHSGNGDIWREVYDRMSEEKDIQ